MTDLVARGLASQALIESQSLIAWPDLDEEVSFTLQSASDEVYPKKEILTTGIFTSERAITSTFTGWASPIKYNGEQFKAIRVFMVLEGANVQVKCCIRDTTKKILTSVTQTISGTGNHLFIFPYTLNSTIIKENVFYLSVQVVNNVARMNTCNMIKGWDYAGDTIYKDWYTTTGRNENDWVEVSSGLNGYTLQATILGAEVLTHYNIDNISGTKTPIIQATNLSNTDRNDPFTGFGVKLNNNIDTQSFNMIRIPVITRVSTVSDIDRMWRKIVVEVRNIDQNGTLLAVGQVNVNPYLSRLENLEILLDKTVTKEMLSTTFFIGYYAINGFGDLAWAGDNKGVLSNYAGISYYRGKLGWASYSGNPCIALEQWFIENPIINHSKYQTKLYKNNVVSNITSSTPSVSTLEVNLPSTIYGVVGKEINIYFDNLIKYNAEDYNFNITCAIGNQYNEKWSCRPTLAGNYNLTIDIYDKYYNNLINATTTLIVKDTNVGSGANIKCLFIGDSTTAAGVYTQELLNLFTSDTNADINLIGTIGTAPNVFEGRGGWTTNMYYTNASSPFVFSGVFNFSQYMTNNGYSGLQYVGIHLGINDIFSYTNDTDLVSGVSTTLMQLDAIVGNIKSYDSNIKIGMMITIPPSRYQDSFGDNYGNGQTRWRYKQNWWYWVKEFITKFKNREIEGIYLVPIYVNLDTVNNMSSEIVSANSRTTTTVVRQNNAVHPANSGYYQMADEIYYWLKSFLT